MSQLTYTPIDRILSKLHREVGSDFNESDTIEWIADALDFLKMRENQEQAVAFIEVKNFEAKLPKGFQMVLQVARDNEWNPDVEEKCVCPETIQEEVEIIQETPTCAADCDGSVIPYFDKPCYRTYFDIQWNYTNWVQSSCHQRFTPIRLANSTFFSSIVCREKDTPYQNNGQDEYTLVGVTEKAMRFSFKEGFIALSYIRNVFDKETGYPMIPDNISYVTAITYFVKWKMAERMVWIGREGFVQIKQDSEQKWLKYCRQAKNWSKMPKGIDDHQDLLEMSHYLIPRHKRYYGFFGNMTKSENRSFNNSN